MSLSRSTFARYLLPVVLLAVFAYSIPLTGCGNQPEPTATPTKTPTAPVTPTSALITASQVLPTFTAIPTSLPTHTPLPTEPPTMTPVPPTVTATPVLSNTVTDEELGDLKMANSDATEDKDAAGGDTQPQVTAPTKAPTPTPEPPPTGPTEMNPLTGLQVAASKLNRRPLGIKVPNFPWEARPQSGLSKADVVIEHEAEANLTRFTAIFYAGDS